MRFKNKGCYTYQISRIRFNRKVKFKFVDKELPLKKWKNKMSKIVFIKQNSPEIIQRLQQAGFNVCGCVTFKDAIWLDYHPDDIDLKNEIHGIGYTDPTEGMEDLSPEERIKKLLDAPGWFSEDREFYDTVDEFLEHYGNERTA